MKIDRNIIQFQQDKAQFDKDLFYVLSKGKFDFSNREFQNEYRVNSMGLRDDEESLAKPEIIVLGDSYAMGWGVDQDSTFAEQLQKSTGMKVLNAGISSYGTAREMLLLQQLDLSNLKYLIIQYCNNDVEENKDFAANENVLSISSREAYDNICKDAKKVNNYYFMKHFSSLGNSIFFDKQNPSYRPIEDFIERKEPTDEIKNKSGVDLFMNVLLHSKELQEVPEIIIFPLDDQPYHYFIDDLEAHLSSTADSNSREIASKITLLDQSEVLQKEDYYLLDQHIKASAHQKIASSLKNIIEEKSQTFDYAFTQTLTFDSDSSVSEGIFKMDSTKEWGPSISVELKQQMLDSGFSTLEIDYELRSPNQTTGMIVVSVDSKENIFWYGKKTIESHLAAIDTLWKKVSLRVPLYDIERKLSDHEKTIAKIFYWNIDKEDISIDNLTVRLRKEQEVIYHFDNF